MARTLKAVAPACKAVGSTFEAWMAPEHAGVRPSVHPNRVEGIVVLVQSKDGSWCVTATFDRGGTASRARHRLQWCAGLLWSKAATETCTREFGAGAAVATRHPVRPPAAQEAQAGGGQPRILETRDWILDSQGWDRVSASPDAQCGSRRLKPLGLGPRHRS